MTQRFWCFTLNNPDGLLDVTFEQWIGNGLRYAIYQHEVGEQGTEHFQGYLELDRGQRLSYVQRFLPGAHFETRRGTQQQAIDYCKKAEGRLDGPWEHGEPTAGQGARADILSFKKAIDDGATDLELWDSHTTQFLRYARMIPQIRMMKQAKRTWKTEVYLLFGPPGSGKSHLCRERAPDAYWKQPNSKWFDGYMGQEDVVIDDYRAWLPWATLLQLLDSYPMTVEIKGGQTNWLAKRIFITSNFLPSDWYDKEDGHKYPIRALTRRITGFYYFQERPFQEILENGPVYNEFTDYDEFISAVTNYRPPHDRQQTISID